MNTAMKDAVRTLGEVSAQQGAAPAETAAAVSGSIFAVPVEWMIGVLVIALIVAIVVVCVLIAQMKTAGRQAGASEYIDEGSLQLHVNEDQFLYRTVERRKIETNTDKEKA